MPDNQYGQPIGDPVEGWRPRTPVGPVVLDGIHCRVEPLEGRHTDDLYDTLVVGSPPRLWTYLSAGPFDDRVPFEAYVESLHANAGWSPHVVVPAAGPAAGRSAGIACYLRCDPAAGSVEVGGLSFAAAIQRTPATSEAMFMMARHVFEDLGYRRYEWKCDALNAASRAAATRLGFTFEGTFRQALRFGHNYIGTEHLLLALLDVEDGTGVLAGLGVDRGRVEEFVAEALASLTAAKEQ